MVTVRGIEEMKLEAAAFAVTLSPKVFGATVVALSGDLGAGKTTFTQELARTFGVTEVVTSPTFVLEKVYQLSEQVFQRLVHIDAYRLTGMHELHSIGWDEIISDSSNLVVIEWPERITDALPKDVITLFFSGSGESREIIYGKEN